MESKPENINEIPEPFHTLIEFLYHELYEQIEMDDCIRQLHRKSTKQQAYGISAWQGLRQQITEILNKAGYDATTYSKGIEIKKDLELGLIFTCKGCNDYQTEETYCFDCEHCYKHCSCPEWQQDNYGQEIADFKEMGCQFCQGDIELKQTVATTLYFKCLSCEQFTLRESKTIGS